MKKTISLLLLFALSASWFLPAQDISSALSPIDRINLIIQELQEISAERENYLQELENTNNERKIELEQRIAELNEREKELNELKMQLMLFGDLIDDQAIYLNSLRKKLTFWRITSGILAASLATTWIMWGASK